MSSIKSSNQLSPKAAPSSYHRSNISVKDINTISPRASSNHSSHQKQYTSSTPIDRSNRSLTHSPVSSRSISSHHSPLISSSSKPLHSLIIDENQDELRSFNDALSRRTIQSSVIGSDHQSTKSESKENQSRRETKSLMTTTPTTFNIAYSPSINSTIRTDHKSSIKGSNCNSSQIGSSKMMNENQNPIEKIEEERLSIRGIGCERNANDLAEIIIGLINCIRSMKKQIIILKEWNQKRKEIKKNRKIEKEKEKEKSKEKEMKSEEELRSLKEDKEKLLNELNELVNQERKVEVNLCRINSFKSHLSSIHPKVPEEVCVWQKEGHAGWRVRKVSLKHDEEMRLKSLLRSKKDHQTIIHRNDSLTYPSRSTIS
ncbi:hypothetical protein DFH28DRAFT_1085279 [Melampsora americana]|nr:hypothetical protein DFH28DRAFT_1085279 [Melampsora americana]